MADIKKGWFICVSFGLEMMWNKKIAEKTDINHHVFCV